MAVRDTKAANETVGARGRGAGQDGGCRRPDGLTAGFLWDAPSMGFGIFYVALFATAAIYVYAGLLSDRPSGVVLSRDVVAEDADHEVEDDSEPGAE